MAGRADERRAVGRCVAEFERALAARDGGARSLYAALEALTPTGVLGLANALRTRDTGLRELTLARVEALRGEVPEEAALLACATCVRNGYVRERATPRLAGASVLFARAALWIRLDDPLASVALAPWRSLERELTTAPASWRVRLLGLWDALSVRERARRSLLLRQALASMEPSRDDALEALRAGLTDDDPDVQAACAARLSAGGAFDARTLALRQMLASASTATRRTALRETFRASTPAAVTCALLDDAAAHDDPHVRLRGVQWSSSHGAREDLVLAATLDPDARVRFAARSGLHRMASGADAREHARDALREGGPSGYAPARRAVGALGALGDAGDRDDWALCARYLSHPSPRVVCEAIRAAASRAPDLFVDVFARQLGHPGRRVALEALRALAQCATDLGEEAVFARLDEDEVVALALDPARSVSLRGALVAWCATLGPARRRRLLEAMVDGLAPPTLQRRARDELTRR